MPATTPERTIRDVHAAHLGPALVRQAIEEDRRTGQFSLDTADRLKRELLEIELPPTHGAEKGAARCNGPRDNWSIVTRVQHSR